MSRWSAGSESIASEMGRQIVDLHDVLTRILRVYGREAAAMWPVGPEPLLGGARPIDVATAPGDEPGSAIYVPPKVVKNRYPGGAPVRNSGVVCLKSSKCLMSFDPQLERPNPG